MPTLSRRKPRQVLLTSLLCLTATQPLWAQPAQPPAAPPVVAAPAPQAQGAVPVAPPSATPPGYPPPPPGYRYVQVAPSPPPVPLQAAPLVPVGYQPAPVLPYAEGEPIPQGYKVVEQPIHGLVVAGWVLTGVSYGIGAMAAMSANFKNESGYLLVPFAGPWVLLGRRHYGDCTGNSDTSEDLKCTADVFVVMGLIMDGLIQAGGGTMLLTGYLAQRKKLVRSDLSLNIVPRPIGTGYGLTAFGTF